MAGSSWHDFRRTLRRDLKEVYHFYLDEEARARLAKMGPIGRSVRLLFWLLKSMFNKLTPTRRVLLLVALLWPGLSFQIGDAGLRIRGLGFFVLLLVLLLELKDKLLAQDELAVGRAVQLALLPHENPGVEGWEVWLTTVPANEVGGDLVDYLKIGEGRWGLALGDVAGKGLGAALLMAKVQATLRALAPSQDSLPALGSQMNAIICRDGLRDRFASLVYIELRGGSGDLRLLNAGHPPPLVLREGRMEELARGAPALGIMPDASYTEERIEIRAGELLVVYSDGVTDAMNERGEFFGRQRLLDLLPLLAGQAARSVAERLLGEVKAFVGDAPASDDLSLLLLRRTS